MTVKELIEILQQFPADAEVMRFNESCDSWYSDSIEYVTSVQVDFDGSPVIK